jgi:hypothetical protein
MALLHGRAGRLTAENGGFRPGQRVTGLLGEGLLALDTGLITAGHQVARPPSAALCRC